MRRWSPRRAMRAPAWFSACALLLCATCSVSGAATPRVDAENASAPVDSSDVVREEPDSTFNEVSETVATDSLRSADSPGSVDSLGSVDSPEPRPDRVEVYYFHRTLRCSNCLKFEAYTVEAIQAAFPDELSTGALTWLAVNSDDPENEHLVDDYHVTESSVIVVEFREGVQQSWANLDAIWGFVRDKPTFLSYIRNEVGSRLDAARETAPAHSDARDSVDPPNETPTGR